MKFGMETSWKCTYSLCVELLILGFVC